MIITHLLESIRLKLNPEDHSITIYNLNLHTERLLKSILELNFKINKNYFNDLSKPEISEESFYKLILDYISKELFLFFSGNHDNKLLDKNTEIDVLLHALKIKTFTGSFNYDNQEKNIYKFRLIYSREGEIKSEISVYKRFLADNTINFSLSKKFKIHSEDKKWRYKFLPREEINLDKLIGLENDEIKPETIQEIIWTNEKNEICEGSFTNIFLRKKNIWITPHIESNLLEGTMRKIVINDLKASEEKCYIDDLISADEIILCNSMLGIIKAVKG